MSIKGYTLEIPRSEITSLPHHLWKPVLSDRDIVDDKSKLNPEMKQPLVYISPYLIEQETQRIKVLTYSRLKGGAESELHDRRSIGLGGHTDTLPPVGVTLIRHLTDHAVRECKEESGIVLDPVRIRIGIQNALQLNNLLMIEDDEPVHSVHLGIPVAYPVSPEEYDALSSSEGEENQVSDLKFEYLDELIEKDSTYELWSKRFMKAYPHILLGKRDVFSPSAAE
jgi:predicted NUDIX family phosphoesterase